MATTMHVSDIAELLSDGPTHFNLSPAMLVEHSIRRNEASWRLTDLSSGIPIAPAARPKTSSL